MHACMHASIHTYITYIHTCMHACIHTYIHTLHTYIHTLHTYIHTYIYVASMIMIIDVSIRICNLCMYIYIYTHIYIHTNVCVLQWTSLQCTMNVAPPLHVTVMSPSWPGTTSAGWNLVRNPGWKPWLKRWWNKQNYQNWVGLMVLWVVNGWVNYQN